MKLIYCILIFLGYTNLTPRLLSSILTVAANLLADRRFLVAQKVFYREMCGKMTSKEVKTYKTTLGHKRSKTCKYI